MEEEEIVHLQLTEELAEVQVEEDVVEVVLAQEREIHLQQYRLKVMMEEVEIMPLQIIQLVVAVVLAQLEQTLLEEMVGLCLILILVQRHLRMEHRAQQVQVDILPVVAEEVNMQHQELVELAELAVEEQVKILLHQAQELPHLEQ